jgi:cell division protease FtsH
MDPEKSTHPENRSDRRNDKDPKPDDHSDLKNRPPLWNASGKKPPGGLSPVAIWIIIFAVIALLLAVNSPGPESLELSYTQFKEKVRGGDVVSLNFSEGSVEATGMLRNVSGKQVPYKVNVVREDTDLLSLLDKNGVNVKVHASNPWLSNLFFTFLSPLIFVLFLYLFIYRGMRGFGKGAMSFGKSKAKLVQDRSRTTFEDVAGIEEAKEEVQEIIGFLKHPEKYKEIGARLPKGVLLVGYPGTGKTLLAKAIAGEAGVPFFSLCGSDFVEMFVGVGASRVRDLFEQGKKNAPCIMFLDEIDAVGRHRGAGIGGGHDEREQTLNALLVELDGFDSDAGVIMVAATNRPDVLDPALLRPGRFDRQIVLDLPDIKAREQILKVHSRKIPLEDPIDLYRIAKSAVFFSGADLANLVNEAALQAARRGVGKVSQTDFEEARDKVRFGRERRSKVVTNEDKRNTAWHEAGHALVSLKCEHHDPLHKVTIIPRGQAAGMAMFFPEEDRQTLTKLELLDKICSTFGGRAAEMVVFQIETTGAAMDLKTATQIARKMVCEWGMSDMGMQTFGSREEHMFLGREIARSVDYSESTSEKIDQTVQNMLRTQYERAVSIIRENRDELRIIAEALLEYETLSKEEILKLLKGETLNRRKIQSVSAKASAENESPGPEKTA